uniref:Uncharacterized protein n=1 Tax=Salix viminalis TaxID=40686 RepID=A0A6N2MTL3_SALVM
MYPVIRLLSCNHHNYRNKTSIKLLDPAGRYSDQNFKSNHLRLIQIWHGIVAREETNSKTNCH